jgi:hypothetical protein
LDHCIPFSYAHAPPSPLDSNKPSRTIAGFVSWNEAGFPEFIQESFCPSPSGLWAQQRDRHLAHEQLSTSAVKPSALQYVSPVIAILIVVMVIPIMIRMPAMLVFIPPPVVDFPAVLTQFVQLPAPVLRLLAPVAVMLDSFVQSVIGFGDAPLAVVIRAQARRAQEHQKTGQCRGSEHGSSKERVLQMSHEHYVLLSV